MSNPKRFLITFGIACCAFLFGCRLERGNADLQHVRAMARETLSAPYAATGADLTAAPFYDIEIGVEPDLSRYAGRETVVVTNPAPQALDRLVFHIYPNSRFLCTDGKPNFDVSLAQVDGRTVTVSLDGANLIVPLPSPLAPGARTTVDLTFAARVPALPKGADNIWGQGLKQLFDLLGGGGKASGNYGIYSHNDDVLSLGHGYPILAAYLPNGWDMLESNGIGDAAYSSVGNYEVTVKATDGMKVVTSGLPETPDSGGVHRYQAASVRDFAVQISPRYASVSGDVDGTLVTSHYLVSQASYGKKVLDYGRRALKYYAEAFGPYPYRKLDIVEAPLTNGAGGMEFSALVTIGSIFYQPLQLPGLDALIGTSSPAGDFMDETLEFVVAHEVAHQWWNSLVGSDSKRFPFLDEALANYSAYLYFAAVHGEKAAANQLDLQMKLPYKLHRFFGGKDVAVEQPTEAFHNQMEYGAIVYGKGPLFYVALEKAVGRDRVLAALRDYAAANRFCIATPEDLLQALRRATGRPQTVDMLAAHWLRERHGDQDIGTLDFAAMVKQFLPPDVASQLNDKDFNTLLQSLGSLVGQLGQQGNQTGEGLQELLKALGGMVQQQPGAKP